MGSCFSVEGGERKEPTETSQVAPADAVGPAASRAARVLPRSPSAPAPASGNAEVEIPAVMGEAARADLISNQHVCCNVMTYEDLYKATEGFRGDLVLGQGGFGPVYYGFLESTNQGKLLMSTLRESHSLPSAFYLTLGKDVFCRVSEIKHSAKNGTLGKRRVSRSGRSVLAFISLNPSLILKRTLRQEVAIKVLNLQGKQGDTEFLAEVMILGKLCHPNLVKLLGCCADGGQRLLVYEYMPLGSLFNHIHDLPPGQQPLDWSTRIEILLGAAKGLQHLHENANPPVINRDVKCANILLGEGYHPKLSDFGLAKLGPTGHDTHVSTRVMGTAGYCAPEYFVSGKLTVKSDIYSFGVVMLEVLTGRKAKDESLPSPEQTLAVWAVNVVNTIDLNSRNSKSAACDKLADPALQGQYKKSLLFQALLVAVLCVSERPDNRPRISEVVNALTGISEGHKKWLTSQQPAGTGSNGNQA